jgi:two-component system, chemotaxis family, chemotaxis protein CheY
MNDLEGLRILIVDDEPFMRATIKAVLRAIGHFGVAEADDGDIAVGEVERFKPDVVLCDISMPRMGGLQFVEQLRKHRAARVRNTPVVILTGHADEATVLEAAQLQISGYLIKPVSPKLLRVQLQKVRGPSGDRVGGVGGS